MSQTILKEQAYFVCFNVGPSTNVSVECKYENQPEIDEETVISDAARKVKEDLGLNVENAVIEIF